MRTCLKRVFSLVLRTKAKKKDHEAFHGLLVPVAGVEPASVISFFLGKWAISKAVWKNVWKMWTKKLA